MYQYIQLHKFCLSSCALSPYLPAHLLPTHITINQSLIGDVRRNPAPKDSRMCIWKVEGSLNQGGGGREWGRNDKKREEATETRRPDGSGEGRRHGEIQVLKQNDNYNNNSSNKRLDVDGCS